MIHTLIHMPPTPHHHQVFNPKNGMDSLVVAPISPASAKHYRLYTR